MGSLVSPFARKQSRHSLGQEAIAENDIDICKAVDEHIPSPSRNLCKVAGDRKRPATPENLSMDCGSTEGCSHPEKCANHSPRTTSERATGEQKQDARICSLEEPINAGCHEVKKRRTSKESRRRRARKDTSSLDLKEFDRLNSTGSIDAVLAAVERDQIDSEQKVQFVKPRRSTRTPEPNTRKPVIVSAPCDFSGTDISGGTPDILSRRSRTGGGGGPAKFPSLKISKDPDYRPVNSAAGEDYRATPRRSLRNATRQKRLDANRVIAVIDLTGDDDVIVLPNEEDELTVEELNITAPPHVFGPISIGIGQIVPYPELEPLNDEEDKIVTKLLRGAGSSRKMSTIPSARITLRWNDFSLLRGEEWLNDEVMNAYMALINDRDMRYWTAVDEGMMDAVPGRPRSYCFNTFFFTRLVGDGKISSYDYKGVERWTTRANVDILSLDNVIVPVNVGGMHWILVVLNIPEKEVYFCDSLHGRDRTKVVTALEQWAFDEINRKHGETEAKNFANRKEWFLYRNQYRVRRYLSGETFHEKHRLRRVPRQHDRGSCGVFTAKMADCIALGVGARFTSKKIELMRRRMALELYQRMALTWML